MLQQRGWSIYKITT